MKYVYVIAVAALCACSQPQVDKETHGFASAAPLVANDALVAARVEGAFVTIDPESALHVAVASHDGTVKLTGKVKSAATRTQFVAAARKIDNVRAVDATLAVDPTVSITKDKVADFGVIVAVQGNIATQAGINALSVHVEAHGGNVTLRGTVATDAIRKTVVDAAKHAAGVKSVKDDLKVGS